MKVKAHIAVTLVLFYSISQVKAQDAKIIPPTPNATKMTEFHATKPSMYTGTASVSVPLYTIDFDGWSLPLSLSYNATGVRTNEEASEVGLGWALNATGVISRTIAGGDDLFPGYSGLKKGYVYAPAVPADHNLGYNWKTMVEPPLGSFYRQMSTATIDTQPDIFTYNFFGFSGSFVLTQKSATTYVLIKKLKQDGCKISFSESQKSFTIITPDGYKGEFNIKEKSTTFSGSDVAIDRMACCSSGLIDIVDFTLSSGRFRTVTSWYLSRVTSPRGRTIAFTYDLNASDSSSSFLSNSRSFAELDGIESHQVCIQTVHEHVYLKKIESDEVRVDFTMEDREDLKENNLFASTTYFPQTPEMLKRFSGMTVTGLLSGSTLNKAIVFKQGYFNEKYHDMLSNNFNDTEYQWLRGRLDRVNIDDQEYRFFYDYGYDNRGVPNKLTTGVDHFGFYNGADNVELVLPPYPVELAFVGGGDETGDTLLLEYYRQNPMRLSDIAKGKGGLLTKVVYPTRGYTVFEYEPHVYWPNEDSPDATLRFREAKSSTLAEGNRAGGARILSIKEYDYDDHLLVSKSYSYLRDTTVAKSSGKLLTPLYNRYAQVYHDGTSPWAMHAFTFRYRTFSSIPGNSAEGKVIGYSRVKETVTGGGQSFTNTYSFENRVNKILAFNAVACGYGDLNGQMTDARNYGSDGKIIQRVVNSDIYNSFDVIPAITYTQQPIDEVLGISPYLASYVLYDIEQTFHTPRMTVTTVADPSSGRGMTETYGVVTSEGNALRTEKKLSYGLDYLLRKETVKTSFGDSIITQYKRPNDYTLTLVKMREKNMINNVIEQTVTKNSTLISATGNLYTYDATNDIVNLSATYSHNRNRGSFSATSGSVFSGSYEKKTDYSLYNSQGKLLEYTDQAGLLHSFIWGYSGNLPIVHGQGVSYSKLNAAHTAASPGSGGYEAALRSHANTVGKLITTFAHNPQIGPSRITDASNLKKSFDFDAYGRLIVVKDDDANISGQNRYHFMTLPLTRVLQTNASITLGSFYDCNVPSGSTITITNNGNDDLHVSGITVPAGFVKTGAWQSGTISAGTSVDVGMSFTGGAGTYSDNVVISSDKTSGNNVIPVTAVYNASGSSRTITPATNNLNFPISFQQQYVNISNTGNACLHITGASGFDPLKWEVTMTPVDVPPGGFTTIAIRRKSTFAGDITIDANNNLGNPVIHVTTNP